MATKTKSQSLVQLLKTRGFINQVPVILNKKTYHIPNYGAPGTFLRQNIRKQWWKAMVMMQSNIFPVECPTLSVGNFTHSSECQSNASDNDLDTIFRSSLQNDCKEKYLEISTLANAKLPFSIASIGDCFCSKDAIRDTNNPEELFFTRHSMTTEMLLQNYVPPSGASRIFDYWLQLRLSWWKRFSKTPSKFEVTSSSTNCKNGTDTTNEYLSGSVGRQSMSIVYNFPWGKETLETVDNVGDVELRKLQSETETNLMVKVSGSTKSVLPHCIQCSTNLELAMTAFLVDSFHERKSLTKSKNKPPVNPVLQLHPHLSPFQVALVITASQASASKELCYISKQLEQDLQKAQVSLFNASEHVGTLKAHFKRNDQLGIPYTLILNENTLNDGVINSRDRDTEIKKPIHVSKAVEEISRNVRAVLE